MRICIEGPSWMGLWTEVSEAAIRGLGHQTRVFFHNRKTLLGRLRRKLHGQSHNEYMRARLLEALAEHPADLLLSIQGRLDVPTIERIRASCPGIRIVYWIGDPLPLDRYALAASPEAVDLYLLPTLGLHRQMLERGVGHAVYFPFAISRAWHLNVRPDVAERRRFACDVSFVGTHTPERERMIEYLDARLPERVAVWGRSWRRARRVRSRGRLHMRDTLKVHACSKIALNLHQGVTANGFNMKLFEIPAAGGFEITDHQPALAGTGFGHLMPSYSDLDELVEQVRFYLANETERERRRREILAVMLERHTYEHRFRVLFGTAAEPRPLVAIDGRDIDLTQRVLPAPVPVQV
ncbi:MAG: glycosyltransferase [Gammaproteobacteria bacterium]|nr:glycosyltransferase [Gammaproteobacteria bacterium]